MAAHAAEIVNEVLNHPIYPLNSALYAQFINAKPMDVLCLYARDAAAASRLRCFAEVLADEYAARNIRIKVDQWGGREDDPDPEPIPALVDDD